MKRDRPAYLRALADPTGPAQPTLPGIEPPPVVELDAAAARKRTEEWSEESAVLFDQVYGQLTEDQRRNLDLPVFKTYVDTLARYKRSERDALKFGDVIKSPSGYPIQSPFLTNRNKAAKELRDLSKLLGFTGDAINGKGKGNKPRAANPFEGLKTID